MKITKSQLKQIIKEELEKVLSEEEEEGYRITRKTNNNYSWRIDGVVDEEKLAARQKEFRRVIQSQTDFYRQPRPVERYKSLKKDPLQQDGGLNQEHYELGKVISDLQEPTRRRAFSY
tara:strand:+ start:104 stop:457 length:354 start_codon:yes stop_codon:yes gene_type:complete